MMCKPTIDYRQHVVMRMTGIRMKRFLLLLAVGSVCCAEKFAQPSDAVLRSAYCIPIVQWGIDYTTKKVAISANGQTREQQSANAQARKALEKWESALHRLRAYLIPRMPNRDPTALALALALKEGKDDAQQLEKNEHCFFDCFTKKNEGNPLSGETQHEILEPCSDPCVDKVMVERMRACAELSWLPL